MGKLIDVDFEGCRMARDSGHVTVFSEDFSDDEGPASPEDSGCAPDSGCFFYGLYIAVREGYANVVMENAHLIQRIAEAEEKVVKLTQKVKKVVKHAEKKRARKAKRAVKKMVKVIKRKLRSGREF